MIATGAEPVHVATVAPWHSSVGDWATGEVTQRELARRQVPSVVHQGPIEARPGRTYVIGGGDLFSAKADRWRDAKAAFRVPGRHVANAVGLDLSSVPSIDWSFAADYPLFTVRDHESAAALADLVPAVRAVPCPATLIEGAPLEWITQRVGFEALRPLCPGGYVVVHRHPMMAPVALWLRSRRVPVVVVDVQPFKALSWRWGGITVPMTFDTSVIGGLVANAMGVVSFSLHLAIFAIGAGTPFAVADGADYQTRKMRRYLARAGVEDRVVRRRDVRRLAAMAIDRSGIDACSARERGAANEHLDEVARACTSVQPVPVGGR